jgi:nicotinate-nucleotide adenylyltransferase
MAEKIGIFGGSFNPVHNGHVKVALDAIKDLNLDRLLIIPAAVNPFKADAAHEAERGLFDRVLLLRAAFNGVAKVTVDERELKRGGISYAIDTVGEIATENPGAEIFF